MKTYSARFVGDAGGIAYEDWNKTVPQIGDVALILRQRHTDDATLYPHLLIRCACGDIDKIPVEPFANGWHLTSRDPVNIEPSILVRIPGVTLCHYFVHGGQLQMLDDTTSPLRDDLSR